MSDDDNFPIEFATTTRGTWNIEPDPRDAEIAKLRSLLWEAAKRLLFAADGLSGLSLGDECRNLGVKIRKESGE